MVHGITEGKKLRRFRYIAFILVLVAQTVLMAHNAIPHHHHHHHAGGECHETCMCTAHSHDHNVCSHDKGTHLCDAHCCETCTLLSDPFECHSQSFGLTILGQYTKIRYFLPEDGDLIFGTPLCIGSILRNIFVVSGLRAPPFYM